MPVDPPRFGCGYWLAESATGRGIAAEAMRSLIDSAQKDHGATDVFAGVTQGNPRSVVVLERLGFSVSDRFETYTRYRLSLS